MQQVGYDCTSIKPVCLKMRFVRWQGQPVASYPTISLDVSSPHDLKTVIEREQSSSRIVVSFIVAVYEHVMKLHMVGRGNAEQFSVTSHGIFQIRIPTRWRTIQGKLSERRFKNSENPKLPHDVIKLGIIINSRIAAKYCVPIICKLQSGNVKRSNWQ